MTAFSPSSSSRLSALAIWAKASDSERDNEGGREYADAVKFRAHGGVGSGTSLGGRPGEFAADTAAPSVRKVRRHLYARLQSPGKYVDVCRALG